MPFTGPRPGPVDREAIFLRSVCVVPDWFQQETSWPMTNHLQAGLGEGHVMHFMAAEVFYNDFNPETCLQPRCGCSTWTYVITVAEATLDRTPFV